MRAQRFKSVATTLVSAFVVIAGLLLFWRGGEWVVDHMAFANDDFTIRRVEIQTDGVISAEQIRRWSSIVVGENLLKIDLREARRDLELNPLIESVSMERVPPSTLRMSVAEREPIARVRWYHSDGPDHRLISDNFVISESGHVMLWSAFVAASEPNSLDLESLPVLEGIRDNEFRPGRRLESSQAFAALRLIRRFGLSPMAGLVDLALIDVSFPRVLVVTTAQGHEITFGVEELDTQLVRWRVVHEAALRGARSIAYLDLSVTNNLPVRWHDTASAAAPPKRVVKPSRYKKKHV